MWSEEVDEIKIRNLWNNFLVFENACGAVLNHEEILIKVDYKKLHIK